MTSRGQSVGQRAPADVAAAEALRPIDAVDHGIGALARFFDGLAEADDIERAAAIGEEPCAVAFGAGMEDLDRRIARRGRVESLDLAAALGIVGIAFGR